MKTKEFLNLGDQLLDATKTRPYQVSKKVHPHKKNGKGKRGKNHFKRMTGKLRKELR